MELYIKLFEVLFPVFFIVGIGYFLGKKSSNIDTSFITNYSANFGTPALIIFGVMSSGLTYSMFAGYFVYWLLAMAIFGITGIIFLVLMKKDYIRELLHLFCLIQEIWEFQFVFLPMEQWAWVLLQLSRP